MKYEIIKSLPETQTAVLDAISTLQTMISANKNTSDVPETPSNTTLANHHHHHHHHHPHQQQQQQRQKQPATAAAAATTTTTA